MIVMKLMGGLGNQMFQYAAGRALALRLGAPLRLDHSFLEADSNGAYTKRHYELGVFNCKAEKANADVLQKVRKASRRPLFFHLFSRPGMTVLKEHGFAYNRQIESAQGDVYLDGFWQSEKYFSGIRGQLLSDFSLLKKLSAKATALKDQVLADPNSVFVHFRRGDYVSLPSAASVHGAAGMDYYLSAVELLRSQIPRPSFYVFSDDIAWVEQHFKPGGAVYVEGLETCEDLELMKNCRHGIIANSSFSWWGTWLNENPEKIVVAPKQWFKESSINTVDLIPASWHRI